MIDVDHEHADAVIAAAKARGLKLFTVGSKETELLRRYGRGTSRHIPIIAFSTRYQDEGRAIALGCDRFLTKPFDVDSLLNCLSYYTA